MKVVLQVVTKANVIIDCKVHNEINNGYVLLVGIGKEDNEEKVKEIANKISKLRVCADSDGKTNLHITWRFFSSAVPRPKGGTTSGKRRWNSGMWKTSNAEFVHVTMR